MQRFVHMMRFREPIQDIHVTTSVMVVALPSKFHILCASSLSVISLLPCRTNSPIALGTRWMAYATNIPPPKDGVLDTTSETNTEVFFKHSNDQSHSPYFCCLYLFLSLSLSGTTEII